MDAHVPYAISLGLRLRGIDVLTAQDDGGAQMDDTDLLDRATDSDRALFTQDEDFLRIETERQKTGQAFAGISLRAADNRSDH